MFLLIVFQFNTETIFDSTTGIKSKLYQHFSVFSRYTGKKCVMFTFFNPIALGKDKIVYDFELFEYNSVNV